VVSWICKAFKMLDAGADLVVIGTAFENSFFDKNRNTKI
jgi:heptaprenylglyceryl phosphate synthase